MKLRGAVISTLLSVLFLSACADKRKMPGSSEGGQHGGGGDYEKSTAAEVHAALDLALELASATDYRKNIFAKFYISMHVSNIDEIKSPQGIPEHVLFDEVRRELKDKTSFKEIFPFEIGLPLTAFGDPSRVTRLETGRCQAPNNPHPSASVSEMTLQASICFSIAELRAIPKSALLRQILGLIIHEAAHMRGKNEPDARLHQKDFLKFFERVEAEVGNIDVKTRAHKVSTMTNVHLANMRLAVENHNPILFAVYLKDLRRLFTTGLSFSLDPIRMQLAAKPVRPDLFDDFARALLTVLFETAVFEDYVPRFRQGEKKTEVVPQKELTLMEFEKLQFEFVRKVDMLVHNTVAYLNGGRGVYCLNPDYEKHATKLGIFAEEILGAPKANHPATFRSEHPLMDTRLTSFKTDLPLFTFPPEVHCGSPGP